jgi:ABC-type transport system involved in multi-copper enzyme maturation permease subunit
VPERILAIALNTYREAARARLLLGVFVLALASSAYSLVIASMSLHNEVRVVADLGAASMSLYAVIVAIVLGSTSLYRELELKTIFPILSRPVRRWEYVVAKYLGTLLTVLVFVALDAAAVFAFLALEADQAAWKVGAATALLLLLLAVLVVRARHMRVYVVVPWSLAAAVALWLLAEPAGGDRQLVLASAVLAICEVFIVAAVAMLFASFSSPVLTATFTSMIFVIGRLCDSLAHLPRKLFGNVIATGGLALSHVLPNLHVYVPARSLLLGQSGGTAVWPYVGEAALQAIFYAAGLLAISALAFRKRDFS